MTEGGALARGVQTQPLKEYASGSHTSGVTSHSDIGKSTNSDTGLESGTGSPPSRSGQAISKDQKGRAIGMPSGSTPLFQLGVSPSSDSEDSEGLQEAPATSGCPIASQSRTGLLSRGAQQPPASVWVSHQTLQPVEEFNLADRQKFHCQFSLKLLQTSPNHSC
jgi:hypothetical protein